MVFRVAANIASASPAFVGGAYGAFHQNGETTLSSNITNNSTAAIQVASTTGFSSSGYILIEQELIQYTSKTATEFGGTITRGVLGTANASHTAGTAVTEAQGTGSPTGIASLTLTSTDFSNNVSIDGADTTKIVFATAGIYNIQISVQLLNFNQAVDNVTIWFAKNGSNITASASIIEIPSIHGQMPGAIILSYNIFESLLAGQYIQAKFTSDSGNTVAATYPAGTSPVHPVSPSVILTAQQVA